MWTCASQRRKSATVNRRLMENDVVILGLTPVGQSLEQSLWN